MRAKSSCKHLQIQVRRQDPSQHFLPIILRNFSLLKRSGVMYKTFTLPETISDVANFISSIVMLLSSLIALIPSFLSAST
jgi:hypothetical protein